MVVKRKVIDISQFNKVVDWEKVKKTGYHVIIRIGYRGSKTGVITYDPKYKEYRDACEKYDIPYSLYFFPCSITDAEAHEEALFIKGEVEASNIKMPIWLDSEVVQSDKSGRSDKLSKQARTRYLKIILDDLLDWGIPCGIYASRSWFYNNIDMSQIPSDAVKNTWVAEYGVSMTKYTEYFVMWQYSSKESVNGINGNVDMSNQYYDFHMTIDGVETSIGHKTETSSEPVKEKSELEKVIEVAKGELGYLEKASKYKNNMEVLYSKTAGASDGNVTKYWHETKPEWQGQPWCFTKGTMILTDLGYKPIEEIKIGDKVVNANGTGFNVVIDTKCHEEDVYNIRAYGTISFNVTGSHPFLSAKRLSKRKKEFSELKFRPVEELNVKDVISSPRLSMEKETGLDYDQLWALGFYVGDGWKTSRGEYRVCGGKDKEALIEAHFKNITKEKEYKSRSCQEYRIKKTDNELFISYLEECGTGAINKRVPHSILFATKFEKRAFIDGYISADGSKNGNVWSVSKELILGFAKICTDLGYGISVREEHRNPTGQIWDTRRNAYRQFNQREVIYSAKINYNNDLQHQSHVCKNENILLPIKSIKNIEEKHIVYNITTDGDHTYLANNLSVHNCADFITWVFQTALGKARATELLKHYPYVYCPTLGAKFTKYTNPQVGDIVIFWRNNTFAHTGLVIGVSGNNFTTIEGNTSGASKIVDNGGGVCQKTYRLSDVSGTKFCRPDYSSTTISSDSNKITVADDMHTVKYKAIVNVTSLAVRLQPTTSAKACSFSPLKKNTEVGVSYETGDWVLVKYDGKYGYVQKKYITPKDENDKQSESTGNVDEPKTDETKEEKKDEQVVDDIHTVKWQGIVNTKSGSLNVRMLPSTTGKLCSFSPLKKGTEVGVCHKQGDWYLIKVKEGKWGYVYASYIKKRN